MPRACRRTSCAIRRWWQRSENSDEEQQQAALIGREYRESRKGRGGTRQSA